MVFPPTAPWWSAGLATPQGSIVPFAGRRLVGCKTSARWAAIVSEAYGVSADGSVVVGWALNAAGQWRAFRWTASGGMEDLNTTYASLLTNGSVLGEARYAISPDGRYIVGWGYNAATGRYEAFLLDTGFPRRGDVDRNGCVDDADLLQVLFAFGGRGYRNEDLNWDGTVDDADLLRCCSTSAAGVDPPSPLRPLLPSQGGRGRNLSSLDESRFTDDESRFTDDESRFNGDESRFRADESRFTDDESRFHASESRFNDDGQEFTIRCRTTQWRDKYGCRIHTAQRRRVSGVDE
jgi:probable HAF family extracellular repeat protein